MWNIVKSLFRYSSKNVLSLTMLSVLLILATTVFGSLNFLSTNLNNSYNYLVNNGNLNNVVINELYSTTYIDPQTHQEITGDQAKILNQQAFKKELANLIGENNFRSFEAIDFSNVNNKSNGFIYKIVNNPNSEVIDKTVIYNGNNVLDQTFDFDQLIYDSNQANNPVLEYKVGMPEDQYNKELLGAQARRLVLFLATKALWTSDVSNFINDANKILNIKDPKASGYDPANKANKTKHKEVYTKINMWTDPTNKIYTPLISKGYRLAFDYAGPKGLIPIVGKIDNLNAYTCVASPSTIEKQNKKIIDQTEYDSLVSQNKMVKNQNSKTIYDFDYAQSQYINESSILDLVDKANPENVIQVDNLKYFIVGSGISPNFMYPVYSFQRQTPNINSEALIFTNDAGYNLAYDSARSAPVETYIAAKVNSSNLQGMIDQINAIASKYMIWPKPFVACYSIDDTNNTQAPVALRVVFIPQLVAAQTTISTILSIFLLALVLMIFIFTIKKFINDLRNPLGVLRANGISKRTIIFAMPILCLIPGLASGLIGYLASQFTQNAFLSLYSFYWTIPTPIITFSPLMFFGLLLVPFLAMSLIAIIYTYFVLRGSPSNLMKDSITFKATPLSKLVSKAIPKGNILTKFRTSIAFSSLPKLTMITVMFSLLMVSINAGLGLNNKFNYAQEMTFKNKDYNFAVDLINPTIQGGQYFRQQSNYPGRVILNNNNDVLNFNTGMADSKYSNFRTQKGSLLYINNNSIKNNYDNFKPSVSNNIAGMMLLNHDPSINDSNWQKSDFNYLKYKLEDPATVNATVGLGTSSTNPWDIARNLAPMNQITLANNMYKKLWTTMFNDTNVYFNDAFLKANGLNKNDTKSMSGKPLNVIIKNYLEKTYEYNPNTTPNPNTDPNVNKNLIKEDTIEVYGDKNNPNLITQQWKVDYGKINNTFTIKTPYIVIMQTLMNLKNKTYSPEFMNRLHEIQDPNYQGTLTPNEQLLKNLNFDYIKNYDDTFFNMFYSYIPLDDNDETYTYVNTYLNNNNSEPIKILGINPNSKYLSLENKNNQIVNDKLKLQNINENDYNELNLDGQNSIHDIYKLNNQNDYTTSLINDPSNYNMIINETAAYKYNLHIGDTVSINPTNEVTVINNLQSDNPNKNIYDQINNATYTFKISDIIETYQNPEFYINQRVANYMLGMSLNDYISKCFYNEYKANVVNNADDWFNYTETRTIKEIDPFNGYFTSQENPDIINSLSLYSQSGLAPGTDKFMQSGYFDTLINNVMNSKKKDLSNDADQSSYISKMTLSNALGYQVDMNATNPTQKLDDEWTNGKYKKDYKLIVQDLINAYGESPLLSSSIYIEPIQTFSELFVNVGSFVNSIFVLILIIILLLTILSIYYLAIDFIKSAMGLISMMRAYGFKNSENVFSFLSIFFPAIIIAFAISFVSIPIFALLQSFILNFANIFLPIGLEWWYVIVGLAVSFGMLSITLLIALYLLKRMNTAKSVNRIQ